MKIAIVAASAMYPSGSGPESLWQTALHGRKWFRDIPATRLPLSEYPTATGDPDSIGVTSAGLIDGWELDQQRYKIPRDQYVATDTTHWLALDVCGKLLDDLGNLDWLDRDRVGVIVGNSLTGEVSRANAMRLRWPYVRQSLLAAADRTGLDLPPDLLAAAEEEFKAPLAIPGSDMLAGGLANTIAGRLTNYFDFHGPGYTVDGACASSLLSIAHVKSLLEAGTIDFGIAGGVDMSIDPFELVGFSRLGAMASEEMRIYDAAPTGFLPGEGCGLVALMRETDAERQGLPILACISGAGMSSDGSGGLTRPAEAGHTMAIERAYRDAGLSADNVGLFEGHGTGTAVGDLAEIAVLTAVRSPDAKPAALGSIKANIGHTKAAAGIAGLLKATWAVKEAVLPPTTGVVKPHSRISAVNNLEVLDQPRSWESDRRVAGVSALGFGGINTHVVIESARGAAGPVEPLVPTVHGAGSGLLVVTGPDAAAVVDELDALHRRSLVLSDAECVALVSRQTREAVLPSAVRVAFRVDGRRSLRENAASACDRLRLIGPNAKRYFEMTPDLAIGIGRPGTVAVMFPGQGAPLVRGQPAVRPALGDGPWGTAVDTGVAATAQVKGSATDAAQPCITTSSLAGIGILEELGVEPEFGFGHSLGELSALAWAGMAEPAEVVALATVRGRLMNDHGRAGTGMLALDVSTESLAVLLRDAKAHDCELAAINGPKQIVVGGPDGELDQIVELARRRDIRSHRLPVSHAFHTRAMSDAVALFAEAAEGVQWRRGSESRIVVSTVSEDAITPDTDIAKLLTSQLTDPVQFGPVAASLASTVDLLVEVGPGKTLSSLVASLGTPVVAMDMGGRSGGTVDTVATLVALGQVKDLGPWLELQAPLLDVPATTRLLTNPAAARSDDSRLSDATAAVREATARTPRPRHPEPPNVNPETKYKDPEPELRSPKPEPTSQEPAVAAVADPVETDGEPVDMLKLLQTEVKKLTGLQLEHDQTALRLSADLHLNSLQVNHLLGQVAEIAGRALPADPLAMSDATLGEAVELLEGLPEREADAMAPLSSPWICDFTDGWEPVTYPRLAESIDETLTVPIGDELPAGPDAASVLKLILPHTLTDAHIISMRDWVLSRDWDTVVIDHAGQGLAAARTMFLDRTVQHQQWILIDRSTGQGDSATVPTHPWRSPFVDLRWSPSGSLEERVCQRSVPDRNPFSFSGDAPLVVVTGGVHGVTAICGMELADVVSAELLFVGRTSSDDPHVVESLQRMKGSGHRVSYREMDITDRAAAAEKLADIAGRVTGIIHGAALNEPQRTEAVDGEGLRRAREVKVAGLENLLRAVDPAQLQLIVTFGSIIERAGLPGQLAYANANEQLRVRTEELDHELVDAKVLHLQWSVWSEVGMGEKLGVLDSLRRIGVVPISPEAGRIQFSRQINSNGPVTRLIMGRFPGRETLRFPTTDTGSWRFIEDVVSIVPGTELIATAELSVPTDRALREHRIQEMPVLPAVLVLEASAQAASALRPEQRWTKFSDLVIQRPVSLPNVGDRAMLTVVAAEHDADADDLAVRITAGGSDVATLRASCHDQNSQKSHTIDDDSDCESRCTDFSGTDSALYGPLFFHEGAFRRVISVDKVTASSVKARLDSSSTRWFSPFLPQQLSLGDPGLLDTSIHTLQACYPQQQLLPVAADSVTVHNAQPVGVCQLTAQELPARGETLRFDVDVTDSRGAAVLSWRGLALQPSHAIDSPPVDLPLIAPMLVREARKLGWAGLDAVVTEAGRGADDALAGVGRSCRADPSGRLSSDSGHASSSTSQRWRITAWSVDHRVGVDWEISPTLTPALPLQFKELLAGFGAVPEKRAEMLMWTALEACKKTGCSFDGLTVTSCSDEGSFELVSFAAGSSRILALATTTLAGHEVCAALAENIPGRV